MKKKILKIQVFLNKFSQNFTYLFLIWSKTSFSWSLSSSNAAILSFSISSDDIETIVKSAFWFNEKFRANFERLTSCDWGEFY